MLRVISFVAAIVTTSTSLGQISLAQQQPSLVTCDILLRVPAGPVPLTGHYEKAL